MSSYSSPVRVVDNCLPAELFARVQQVAHRAQFGDVINPVDGVSYPDVCADIPMWMQRLFAVQIGKAVGRRPVDIDMRMVFMRLTTDATAVAPHGAHNDISHGEYSMFFYVNDVPADLPVAAGTSLLSHKVTGLKSQPRSVEEWECWNNDTNCYDCWNIDELVEWRQNRMAIYPADRMHRAEPVGGWGSNQTDGRLVLIIFFS